MAQRLARSPPERKVIRSNRVRVKHLFFARFLHQGRCGLADTNFLVDMRRQVGGKYGGPVRRSGGGECLVWLLLPADSSL